MTVDKFTMDLPLPGAKRRVGRPAKPDALTPAERSRRYRQAQKQKVASLPSDEKIYTQAEYESLQRDMIFSRNSMWKMENTIQAMEKEQALLIEERARLFAEVERLQAELARKS